MRNTKGQFIKGERSSMNTEFVKGVHTSPKTEFKKGIIPHNKGKYLLVSKKCLSCDISFESTPCKKAKYCSLLCANKVNFAKGRIVSEAVREKQSKSKLGIKHSELHNINIGNSSRGENNGNWITDRSLIKLGDRNMHDPLTKQWRKQCKDRDNWACRIADNNCEGRLEVHHILRWVDFPELRYVINNGITLCHFHHPRAREEEKRLSPYFTSLVSVSKKPISLS
jgi:hypothetical protein